MSQSTMILSLFIIPDRPAASKQNSAGHAQMAQLLESSSKKTNLRTQIKPMFAGY
jgi:hypothetical protein